ncbi:MAG: glycosyltransferase family 4 protein [Elusimicrobiota bacterium]
MTDKQKASDNRSSLAVFSIDMFHVKDGRLWSSPLSNSSIRLLADNFRKVGIVAHYSPDPPDPEKCAEWPEQYSLYPIPKVRGVLPRIPQAIKVFLLARKLAKTYETIYLRMFSLEVLPAALYCALFYRRPWFMTLHGDIEEVFTISRRHKSRLTRFFLKRCFGYFARLICRSPAVLFVSGPALGEKYAAQRSDWVAFVGAGVRERNLFIQRRDTCESSPCRLIYAGEFSWRKGIDILFQALAILKEQAVPVRLTLAGTGDREWLDQMARELRIGGEIDFAGYLTYGEPLFSKIRESDILVVPSLGSEGLPAVITDANAQGLPIVVSDVNSLGVAVREWSCGLVVPPGDPRQLASAIKRIIDFPEERRMMVAQSLKRAGHFTYEKEFLRMRAKLEDRFADRLRPIMEINRKAHAP